MQQSKLASSTGFDFSNVDISGSQAVSPIGILNFDCGFNEPSLI
jgi:hypothetical protein